jgi:hypothetical protein
LFSSWGKGEGSKMNKSKAWGVAAAIGILIGITFWWTTSVMEDRKDPLNKSDAFVFCDNGRLYWFELSSRGGKVKGQLHQQKIIEEIGKPPVMKAKKYAVTGKTTEKGYEFKVKNGGEFIPYDAWFSGGNLLVQKQGEKDHTLYKAVSKAELDDDVKAIQQELQILNYYSEEKEKTRIRNFFTKLKSVYGYLYTAEDGQYQLFIKIDEALLQGELSGSLLKMDDTGDKTNPYKETKYALNGITDGIMLDFYTAVDGKETKMKGNFYKDARGFDLSFWLTNQKLAFHAVSEDEFKKSYEEFKTKAQKGH